MEIKWSDDALRASAEKLESILNGPGRPIFDAMREILNAAVEYEGVFPTSYVVDTQRERYDAGRAEALNEAERALIHWGNVVDALAAISALKDAAVPPQAP